jgi:hypothetical protein
MFSSALRKQTKAVDGFGIWRLLGYSLSFLLFAFVLN